MSTVDEARPGALILDPFAGISGDMLLGALLDLGLEPDWLEELVGSLGLGASVVTERVDRSGISCGRVRFEVPEEPSHRRLPDVLAIVESSGTEAAVRTRAGSVFRLLAEAEAAVHGIDPEEVHFHEVGALDAILDVLCVVAGARRLGYRRFFTRPVAVGTGTVAMAHGEYPLPAPATARLLKGAAIQEVGYAEECTTPTGAALLMGLTGGEAPPNTSVLGRTGYGAGTRNPQGRPNCLRVMECHVPADTGTGIFVVVADLDDLAPEYVAGARDALLDGVALDATVTRLEMKKGRPGVRLEALVEAAQLERAVDLLFRGTTTIGVRYWPVERVVLERQEERLEWRGHAVRAKRVSLPDGRERWKPEMDDVVAAARSTGLTPHEVRLELDRAERNRSEGRGTKA